MKISHTKTLLTALFVSVLATACNDEKPEEQIRSAKEYLEKDDSKSALIQVKNALQQNPGLGEARFLLGTILLKEENAVGAEIEFRKALAAKHPEAAVVPELARAMLMLSEAKKLTDEFGATRFNQAAADASLQTTLTAAYAVLGKPESGEAALTAALAADPNYVPALILRARQKAAASDFDGALLVIEDTLAKAPGNADVWKLKGDLLMYGKNNADDAFIAYRKSIEIKPKVESSHLAVLAILRQQNKLDEASKQLVELKKFAAKSLETKYAEAQLAYQKKDYKLARSMAQELLRLASKNPRVLQLAGAIEFQTNSLAQAEIYLVLATQAEPKSALSQRLLISTYLRSGQSAKALTALNAITGKDGLDPSFFSLAGQVHLQNGDSKTAEDYFAKALKSDPSNAKTRTALAVMHLASGQGDSAFAELENISESGSGTQADLALISAHLNRKDFDKALAAVAKLEAKQPDKPVAANLRGRIQLVQKDTAGARKSFERALAIDPTFFAAAASLATLDLLDKKPADAKKRFENLLTKNPKNGQALLALAELAALQKAGKDEVAGLLTQAIEANPTEVPPRLLLIELHLRTNDNKRAMVAAQSAVSAVPTSADLLDALGRVQQASGDLNQAAATFIKLVAMQPLSPLPHLRLAVVQHANKNNQASEQSLRKALEIKPDSLDAQRALIILFLESKRYADAMKLARNVQAQRPKAPAGFVWEGDTEIAQKNWNAAASAYKTGLQRVAATELATRLYSALLASGKAAESEKFAQVWLKDHPQDADFISHLGDTAIARKDYKGAEIHYLALLKIRPDTALALNNLAWVMNQLRKDGAIEYAEKANKLLPNQPAFMDTWAQLLNEKNEYSKAIDLQKKAVELQPSNPGFRLNLAKIYIKSGDKGKAKSELDILAKLGDKFSSQAEVSELLKTL